MNKVIVWVIVLVVVVWGGFAIFKGDSTPKETGPIKIGFIGPLTGDAANIGQNAKSAVEIAVEEVNAAGGIDGRMLEVIYEDGSCNGPKAASAASKLINVDKVAMILGGACSGETSSFTAAAEQAMVPVLSYCSSAPSISNAGDYIFRNYPSDLYQGAYGAEYIANKLGKKKVAILYVQSDWGSGIKDVFTQKLNELGGSVVAEEGYAQTSKDLRSQLTKIKAAQPELIYFLGYTDASIPGIKQAKELGLTAPLFGADAWDDSKIWQEAGAAGEGAMFSVASAQPSDTFKSAMRAKVGNDEIGACSPYAYDAVKIIAKVLEKSGTDRTAIKDELYKVTYTGGVSSDSISFDQNGDPASANYIVKKVSGGKASEIE